MAENKAGNIELHSCSIEKSTMSFPMGALCIKTAINTQGKLPKAVLHTHYLSDDPQKKAQECAERRPVAISLSMYLWNISWMESFAKKLKELTPNLIICAGGPAITVYEEKGIPTFINFAVRGEGEITTPALLEKALAGEKVTGIHQAQLPDLSKMPSVFLSHEADSILEGTDSVLWELTRGCPYQCAFCFESRGNRIVRDYPFERIEPELQYLIDHEICNVFVLDPTFNLNPERAKKILRLLLENAPAWMHFTFEIRVELVDEELAELFGKLNCSLQIGLQSSDASIIKTINRHFDPEEFKQHVKLLEKSGAAYGFDIIIGLPGDDLRKFRKTVDFAVALKPSNIDCFTLSLLPDTELWAKAEEYGYTADTNIERTITSSPTFSANDIAEAQEIKNNMDLFYTKGQADMWIHCILETLNITACNLFSLFGKWMKQTGRSADEDIWVLQDDFVTSLFQKTQNNKLLPAMKSFMELHQGICYVTDTGESAELDLSYSPDELSLLDSMSLSEFVKTHRPHHYSPVVEMDDEAGICFR